jgi:UDP-N-acetylglucosamine 2-epimerase (non-hydrolysing)
LVVVFYGTSAELIKLLGIVKGTDRDNLLLICTAQQKEQIEQFHTQSGIYPDMYLAQGWRGHDVLNMAEMLGFMIKLHLNFIKKYRSIMNTYKASDKKRKTKSIAVVHGDTLTTVVGAYFGRLLGLKVAHIEAGLRSGKAFHPFPEEIDRRIVTKIARVHFAPNQHAIDNLNAAHAKGDIIDTKYNTSKDAIEIAAEHKSKLVKGLNLPKHYGLISIHRTELLERKKELEDFIKAISAFVSNDGKMVFLDHSTTKDKLRVLGFDHYLKKEGMIRIPKLAYMDFIQVAKHADYILTDSGGLQEDAYFLGKPTMIHRLATERNEGLGQNVELSYLDIGTVERFLHDSDKLNQSEKVTDKTSPSKIVIDYFMREGYIS